MENMEFLSFKAAAAYNMFRQIVKILKNFEVSRTTLFIGIPQCFLNFPVHIKFSCISCVVLKM